MNRITPTEMILVEEAITIPQKKSKAETVANGIFALEYQKLLLNSQQGWKSKQKCPKSIKWLGVSGAVLGAVGMVVGIAVAEAKKSLIIFIPSLFLGIACIGGGAAFFHRYHYRVEEEELDFLIESSEAKIKELDLFIELAYQVEKFSQEWKSEVEIKKLDDRLKKIDQKAHFIAEKTNQLFLSETDRSRMIQQMQLHDFDPIEPLVKKIRLFFS